MSVVIYHHPDMENHGKKLKRSVSECSDRTKLIVEERYWTCMCLFL